MFCMSKTKSGFGKAQRGQKKACFCSGKQATKALADFPARSPKKIAQPFRVGRFSFGRIYSPN